MTPVLDFNVRHLEAVVAIGRCGSISGASVEVNLSQPALTQALAKLEAQLGRRLFDRQSDGVSVTEAGRLFLARAEWALSEISDAVRALRRTARLRPIAYPERVVSMAQLRSLLAVSRAGSYALGARELGLSQPSIRRAVKELELLLQVELVVRAGRAMRSTTAAERLLRSVRLAFAELEAGLDELKALDMAGAGRLCVGALPSPRAALLPEALARFSRGHPFAQITIVEASYGELLPALRAGEIDLFIGALRHKAPSDDIVQEELYLDDLYIVARTEHPLVGHGAADPGQLARYPWVVGATGSPMRGIWEAMFASVEPPTTQIQSESILTARSLLIEGDWLAIMAADQFKIEETSGLLATVGPSVARRDMGFTTRVDWRPTATQQAFLRALRDVAATRRKNQ